MRVGKLAHTPPARGVLHINIDTHTDASRQTTRNTSRSNDDARVMTHSSMHARTQPQQPCAHMHSSYPAHSCSESTSCSSASPWPCSCPIFRPAPIILPPSPCPSPPRTARPANPGPESVETPPPVPAYKRHRETAPQTEGPERESVCE